MASHIKSDHGGGDYDSEDGDDDPLAMGGSVLGTPPDDLLLGTSGGDLVFGFAGTDYIIADAGTDVIRARAGDDGDGDVFGAADDVFGGLGDDLFIGWDGDGDDTSYDGGIPDDAGNDTVTMSNAVDVVDGEGSDAVFLFGSAAATHGETIPGFEAGDRIDLSRIDANAGTGDNFTLENGQSTTAPGQIVVAHETREDGEHTVISGNTSGDNAPEFGIGIPGNHNPGGSDFQL